VLKAAAARGLTHLAITDHERIDAAQAARAAAPEGLTVIVGQEVRSAGGDLIGMYLSAPVPAGLPAVETAQRIRDQGGLVGVPHPFDRFRSSAARGGTEAELEALLELADYVEVFNARVVGTRGNERAAQIARERGIAGVAVSDAHTVFEVGVSYTFADGPIDSADDLRRALATAELVMSRGSYFARAAMPFAKVVQRWRGNERQAGATGKPHSVNGQ